MVNENSGSNSNDESNVIELTEEEISSAKAAEQAELTEATIRHLQNRVVTLRALVNKLQAELEEHKNQKNNDDS